MTEKSESTSELSSARRVPSSEDVSKAAYDVEMTMKLVRDYQLTAVEIAQLIERLPEKPVPW